MWKLLRLGVWATAEMVNLDRIVSDTFEQVNWTWKRSVQIWFLKCCWLNKKNFKWKFFLTFCRAHGMNQICWSQKLLVMRLGYLCMTRKQNDSQCTASYQTLQEQNKSHMSHSKFKAMLLVFFDIQGDVVAEWVPSGQNLNQHHYIDISIKLHEHMRRKRPWQWRNGWILLHDNMLCL